MQVPSKAIRFKTKPILLLAILILILGIVTPVLADYLGPDRTTTESHVETFEYGVWAKDDPGYPGNPTCNHAGGGSDCIVCTWERTPGNACGDAEYSYALGTKSEVVTTTVNLPPATISNVLQNCNLNNGWCNTPPQLSLNAIEPLVGYSILAIEGSLNGQIFACAGTTCNVSLNEGDNIFNFWAISSWGDSSEMGTFTSKVDTIPPTPGMNITGSNGTNSWYISQTSVTATGSDSTSGLASVLLSVNSGAWQSSATLNEGVHNVVIQAQDYAGNTSNASTTISVDTTTPSIDISLNGTSGNNGWYISNMQLTASTTDATSGVALLEVSSDGIAYQAYTSPISFTDGHHTLQFKATDKAGNTTETPAQEFFIDTLPPAVDIPSSWEVNETIEYSVQDDGSGLSELRVVVEDEDEKYAKIVWIMDVSGSKFKDEIVWDGKFKDGTVAPPGEYLVWIKVSDQAGNERFGLGRVTVPSPFSLFQSLPTANPSKATPTPPKELFEEEVIPSSNTIPPTTTFGNTTSQPKETESKSLTIAPVATEGTSSTTTSSNVLWGATAAAVIGAATAYALDEQRKRKEEEARQLAEAMAEAESLNLAEQVRWWASATGQDEEVLLAQYKKEGMTSAMLENKRQQVIAEIEYSTRQEQKMQNLGLASSANADNRTERKEAMLEEEMKSYSAKPQEWEAGYNAYMAQKAAEEKQTAENLQAGLAAYYNAMKQGEKENSGSVPPKEKPWWEKLGGWITTNASNIGTSIVAARDAYNYRGLTIRPLDSGMVSVSAGNIPSGMRRNYFNNELTMPLKPGRYSATTVQQTFTDSFIKGATNSKAWGIAGVTNFASNLYAFGHDHTSSWDDFTQATVAEQEFWVSTGVDTVLSVLIGAGVAALVAATFPVTAPVALTALVAGGLAIGTSALLYNTPVTASGNSVPDLFKSGINAMIDIAQNPLAPSQQAVMIPTAPPAFKLPVSITPSPSNNIPSSSTALSETVQAVPAETPLTITSTSTSTPQP